MSLPRKEMDVELKRNFVPLLKSLGFTGTYPHFRREGPKYMELVGVQFSQWGGQFYVELSLGSKGGTDVNGKFIPAQELKHYHGWPRERLGELPFDYERDGVQMAAAKASKLPPAIDDWFRAKSS